MISIDRANDWNGTRYENGALSFVTARKRPSGELSAEAINPGSPIGVSSTLGTS